MFANKTDFSLMQPKDISSASPATVMKETFADRVKRL
jgi:hypothetical protein